MSEAAFVGSGGFLDFGARAGATASHHRCYDVRLVSPGADVEEALHFPFTCWDVLLSGAGTISCRKAVPSFRNTHWKILVVYALLKPVPRF